MERLWLGWLGRVGSGWRRLGGYGGVHCWIYVRVGVFAFEIISPEVALQQ